MLRYANLTGADLELGGQDMEQNSTGIGGGPDIKLAPGAEEVGLAVMLADMIKSNLDSKPSRMKDFRALQGPIYIFADDADVDMTMAFSKGSLTVFGGRVGKPVLEIVTDSETLLSLANISIKFGLPFFFDKLGIEVVMKLLKRQLKIKGMIFHPFALVRLTKVMSVN